MPDQLEKIIAHKRKEIAERHRPVRDRELLHLGEFRKGKPSFSEALRHRNRLAVIGEIKRKSPSAGSINDDLDASEQCRTYLNAGIDAISVLTDEAFFGGHLRDLWEVSELIELHQRRVPCLRKDFFIDPIQVVEAAEAGAAAILIIVRALSDEEIRRLAEAARLAGLESLFEVHTLAELDRALRHEPGMIGVNNRDLSRFVTSVEISETIIPQIPPNLIRISESGIFGIEEAARARKAGADAILVGEALVRHHDPETLVREFHLA